MAVVSVLHKKIQRTAGPDAENNKICLLPKTGIIPYFCSMYNDTICALATANGIGALGIIRLSGGDAVAIVNKVFEGKNLEKAKSHTVHYGFIKDGAETVDEVMVSVFLAPKTFTTENSVEISFHGSPYIGKKILEVLLKNGARMAKAGEFTMRAFMNGRIDLSQAESLSLIHI